MKGKVKLAVMVMLSAALFVGAPSAAFARVQVYGDSIEIALVSHSGNFFSAGVEWDGEWKFETQGDGSIEEISLAEFKNAVKTEDARRKELAQAAGEEEFSIIEDEVIPGAEIAFYFKGVTPGTVELIIANTSPSQGITIAEGRYKLAISPDLRINVLDSSEEYNWSESSGWREFLHAQEVEKHLRQDFELEWGEADKFAREAAGILAEKYTAELEGDLQFATEESIRRDTQKRDEFRNFNEEYHEYHISAFRSDDYGDVVIVLFKDKENPYDLYDIVVLTYPGMELKTAGKSNLEHDTEPGAWEDFYSSYMSDGEIIKVDPSDIIHFEPPIT